MELPALIQLDQMMNENKANLLDYNTPSHMQIDVMFPLTPIRLPKRIWIIINQIIGIFWFLKEILAVIGTH